MCEGRMLSAEMGCTFLPIAASRQQEAWEQLKIGGNLAPVAVPFEVAVTAS